MSFVGSEILTRLGEITREEADKLQFGAVKVDNNGRIVLYNHYESQIGGIAPSSAEGKNFFTEIAPCTNNKLVYGRFKKGIQDGDLDAEMNYTFTYKMKPTNVTLHLKRDSESNSNWIFVKAG